MTVAEQLEAWLRQVAIGESPHAHEPVIGIEFEGGGPPSGVWMCRYCGRWISLEGESGYRINRAAEVRAGVWSKEYLEDMGMREEGTD